ncbi:MAG TPA: hypothetical protein VEI50_02380 [Nitrospiraceae bacterium]|nr:hypothetical protein [Nitrospiraceae bacterium]
MTQKFHERFNIHIPIEEEKKKFVNRVHNQILEQFWWDLHPDERNIYEGNLLMILGIKNRRDGTPLHRYIREEFWANVKAVEAISMMLKGHRNAGYLEALIMHILSLSEVDLGIRWHEGQFRPSGSGILDEKLVNDVLGCLQGEKYDGVRSSFNKGLEHLLHSIGKPQLLSDVITDMYEALEGLAKVVTGRGEKDLSGNAESFIKAVEVSDLYKPILKEYVVYGNKIRHAGKDGQPKPDLTRKEVESFVYLTGVFIRLALITKP